MAAPTADTHQADSSQSPRHVTSGRHRHSEHASGWSAVNGVNTSIAPSHTASDVKASFDGTSQDAQHGMHSRNADGTIWTPDHRQCQTAGNSRPIAVIDKMPQNTDAITGDDISAGPIINTISTGQKLHQEKYSTDSDQTDADSTDSSTSSSISDTDSSQGWDENESTDSNSSDCSTSDSFNE